MRRRKFLLLLLPLLMVLPVLLDRTARTQEAKAVRRLVAEALAAMKKLPEESQGAPVEPYAQFGRDLKDIDRTGVPPDVRLALDNFIREIEANVATRRAGGDTNAAARRWHDAEINFFRRASQYTTQPF